MYVCGEVIRLWIAKGGKGQQWNVSVERGTHEEREGRGDIKSEGTR